MKISGQLSFDPLLALAATVGTAGLILLAPLMFDQLVFFGDQEQSRQAALARAAMPPAAALLVVASAVLAVRRRPWHALLVLLPALVAVPLALMAPDAAYQLAAYACSAPVALGALLSAAVPLPRRLPMPVLVLGAGTLLTVAVLTAPLGLLAVIAALVWWRLPPRP